MTKKRTAMRRMFPGGYRAGGQLVTGCRMCSWLSVHGPEPDDGHVVVAVVADGRPVVASYVSGGSIDCGCGGQPIGTVAGNDPLWKETEAFERFVSMSFAPSKFAPCRQALTKFVGALPKSCVVVPRKSALTRHAPLKSTPAHCFSAISRKSAAAR